MTMAMTNDDGSKRGDAITIETEKLRARQVALAAARAAREAERARVDELEALRRAVADAEAIEAAELEYGPLGRELAAVHTDMGVVLVKRPHAALFKRYQDLTTPTVADVEKLVLPSIVYPPPGARDDLLDRLPGTLQRLTNAVGDLAGVRQREQAAKY